MSTVTNHTRLLSSHLDPARPGQAARALRPLGASGLRVPPLGLSTSALASPAVPEAELREALESALDQGLCLVQVSFAEAGGRALRQLGFAMQGRRASTRVCLRAAAEPRELRRQVEAALRQLDTDHLDIALAEEPGARVLRPGDPLWSELEALRREGKLLAAGAALSRPEEARAAVELAALQVLQVPFNVFRQDCLPAAQAAAAKGLGVLAAQPLDSGWLTGRYGAGQLFLDSRRRWSRADKARRARLQEAFEAVAVRSGLNATQAALQFVLGFPELSCAVAGASAWQHLVGNADAAAARLDPGAQAALRGLWERELREQPLQP